MLVALRSNRMRLSRCAHWRTLSGVSSVEASSRTTNSTFLYFWRVSCSRHLSTYSRSLWTGTRTDRRGMAFTPTPAVLKQPILPRGRRPVGDQFERQVILKRFCPAPADPFDHLDEAVVEIRAGAVSKKPARLLGRTIRHLDFHRPVGHIDGFEIFESDENGDLPRQFIDADAGVFLVRPDVDRLADDGAVESHLEERIDDVVDEGKRAFLLAVPVDDPLGALGHEVDHDRRDVPVGVVVFLARADDVVRDRVRIFDAVRLREALNGHLGRVLGDPVGIDRQGRHVFGEGQFGLLAVAGHAGAKDDAARAGKNGRAGHRYRGVIGVQCDEVGREDGQPLVWRRGAVVDDFHSFQKRLHLFEIARVRLVEFDVLRNIVPVSAQKIVDPDDLVSLPEKPLGKVAAQKTGDAGYKNFCAYSGLYILLMSFLQ